MSVRKALRVLAAVPLAAAAMVAVLPGQAGAEAPDSYGWWFRAQTPHTGLGAVAVPPPPDPVVPEGGFYISQGTINETPEPDEAVDPTQPLAIAAMRFTVPDEAEAVLQLRVAEGYDADGRSETQELPGDDLDGAANKPVQIDACLPDPAAVTWDAPEQPPGRWEDRPAYDCDSYAVTGSVEEDGTLIAFTFDQAVIKQYQPIDGIFEVILVPQGDEPFGIAFSPPDSGTLLVTDLGSGFGGGGGDFGGDTGGGGFTDGGFDDGTDFGGDFSGEGFAATDFGDSGFDAAGDDAFASPVTEAPRPRVTSDRPVQPALALPEPIDDQGERRMAVLLLLGIAGALWWVGGAPVRPPRLLGSLGSGAAASRSDVLVRGVGRFARPRQGRPTRL